MCALFDRLCCCIVLFNTPVKSSLDTFTLIIYVRTKKKIQVPVDWVGRTSRTTCPTVDSGCLGCISAIFSVHEGEQEEAVGLLLD